MSDSTLQKKKGKRSSPINLLLNVFIVLLGAVVIFLLYSFVSNSVIDKKVDPYVDDNRTTKGNVVQLDVLNGCGASGTAQKFTDYLRRRNFDVVQMGNYSTFDVEKTLVIDRVGDTKTAKKVAHALGIDDKNIIQQISPDYYLDVSVVIGKDYTDLKPFK